MESGTFNGREDWMGIRGGAFKERVSFQQARDQWVVGLVGRYGIVSADQLAARIGYAATPQGMQDADRILQRLAAAGEVQRVSQHGTHYALSVETSLRKKGAKAQLPHRVMASERRMALDQVVTFEEYRTGEVLRAAAKGFDVIPDGFGRIEQRGWFFEDETGSHTVPEMVQKGARYYSQLKRLQTLFSVTQIRVVWGLKIWKQAVTLALALKGIGSNGELFLVTHHPSTFDLRHTARLRSWSLFFSPIDDIDRDDPVPQRRLMEETMEAGV